MTNILVLGDSHAEVFRSCNGRDNHLYFDVTTVGGATAYGLQNSNSTTKAFSVFTDQIKNKYKQSDYLLLMLGEVDCGFLMWHRMLTKHISLRQSLADSVESIKYFLCTIVLNYFAADNVIITGAHLQCVIDNAQGVLIQRRSIDASQYLRTKLTLHYNKALQDLSNKYKLKYLDITNETLDFDTQIINNKFCKCDNNHLLMQYTMPIWLHKVRVSLIP